MSPATHADSSTGLTRAFSARCEPVSRSSRRKQIKAAVTPAKGQEMLGLALVAAVQATAAGQPRHRPLHGPTVTAKPLSMELGAPTATLPAPGTDRRDAVHQGFHALAVVGVRGRGTDREVQTGPLSDQVDLRALLATIYGIRTRQIPPFAARMFTESVAQRDQSARRGHRARPAPGGGACPRPGPCSTR